MIYIDRSRVEPPRELLVRWNLEEMQARAFFETEAGASGQGRFRFRAYQLPEVKEALGSLFHGKCAFCESFERQGLLEVEQFRPKQNTVGSQGEHAPLHYWWLAGQWENLYLACHRCKAAKSNRFPIGNPRGELEATGRALDEERPLLLDPCDPRAEPEQHLVYAHDASVTSDTERGRVTIELFGLNRDDLQAARRTVLERLRRLLSTFVDLLPDDAARVWAQIEPMLKDEAEFAGMCRQTVRRFFEEQAISADADLALESGQSVDPEPTENVTRSLGIPRRPRAAAASFEAPISERRKRGLDPQEEFFDLVRGARFVPQQEQSKIAQDFTATMVEQDSYSLDQESAASSPEQAERYYHRSRTVERIVLHNFRGFEHLDLELPRREGPWTVLLGENGCGKSSVLQAVALALMGQRYRDSLRLDARDFVRKGSDGQAYVQVFLSGMNEPIRLEFGQGGATFQGAQEPKVLLLAYGATRLLPRPETEAESYGTDFARAHNLFDPFRPLADAQDWLLSREPAVFEDLKPPLKALLNLGPEDDLQQNQPAKRIDVRLFGTEVPLAQLSDGYQTVLAMTAEVMSVLLDRWKDMAVAEGVVLLDELGSHLHPKWKMQIVSSLRHAFPAVQFIATTHDPLCLRGLEDGEVVVLRRNSQQHIVQVEDLPPVKALRVDQLLTSEHFGLSSTQDPAAAELLERYHELLARDERTEDEAEELRKLHRGLDGFRLLGQTRRERLMLTAIDLFLAREDEVIGTAEFEDRKAALDRQLQRILESA